MAGTKGIKLETLRELAGTGSVRDVVLIAQGSKWSCLIRAGLSDRQLVTDRGQVRFFGKLETAVRLVRDVGISRMTLEAANFDAVQRSFDMRSVPSGITHTQRHA